MPAKPSYCVETVPNVNYIRLTFSGIMDADSLDAFEQELTLAFERMRAENGLSNDYLMLVDTTEAGVVAQQVTTRAQTIIARFAPRLRRIAILVSASALEMMQAKRVAGIDTAAFFRDEVAASAWLFEDDSGAR